MKFLLLTRPRFNHWHLSKNNKWSYKEFKVGIPFKKTLYFLRVVVWIKYNWHHAEITQSLAPHARPDARSRSTVGWNLGVVSFYTLGK